MENAEQPKENKQEEKISRLRELQKMQGLGKVMTEEERRELVSLHTETKPLPKSTISEEEKKILLQRQVIAGAHGNPPLTEEEKIKLQEIHGLR